MAYLKPIPKIGCQQCTQPATVQVVGETGIDFGCYCQPCGHFRIRELNPDVRNQDDRPTTLMTVFPRLPKKISFVLRTWLPTLYGRKTV